jgi:hypothetical protein
VSSLFRDLRQEWIDFLDANPFFDGIALVPENKKDITNEITRALGPLNEKGGKIGIAVVFMTVTARPTKDGGNGPVLDVLNVARVIENPVVNNTGTNYDEVAEKIAKLTHGFTALVGNSPFMLDDAGISLGNDTKFPSKDVFFTCTGNLGIAALTQAAKPAGVVAAGHLTLTCATPGAAMFYTVNGSTPNPQTSTLYTAPFAVNAGQTIKARAWLAGFLTSDLLKLTV